MMGRFFKSILALSWRRHLVLLAGLTLCLLILITLTRRVTPTMRAIQSVGGEVVDSDFGSSKPSYEFLTLFRSIFLRDSPPKDLFLGPRDLSRLGPMQVYNERLTDEAILQMDLSEIGHPQMVVMSGPQVTDRGFSHIASCKPVYYLSCRNSHVTDAGLAVLSNNLRTLDLSGNEITDAGISSLARGTLLIRLDLNNTRITDTGLKKLAASCTGLMHLSISSTDVTDTGLADLSSLPKLSGVSVDTAQLTDVAMSHLLPLKLDCLGIGNCSAEKQSRLRQRREKAQVQIDDDVLARIAQIKTIKYIHLIGNSPDEPVALTPASVKSFASLPALTVLLLSDIKLDPEVLSQIQRKLPALKIWNY